MNRDDDDPALAKVWRDVSGVAPDPVLDARILATARAHQRRRLLVPLGALLAACLVLAVHLTRQPPQPVPEPELANRAHEASVTAMVADPEAMHQMLVRQMPGGAAYSEIVHK